MKTGAFLRCRSAVLVLLALPSQDPLFCLDDLSCHFDILSIAMFWVGPPVTFAMVISFPVSFSAYAVSTAHWTMRTGCIHPG